LHKVGGSVSRQISITCARLILTQNMKHMILKTFIIATTAFSLLIASCGNPGTGEGETIPVDSILPDELGDKEKKGMEYMEAFRGEFLLCKKDKDGYYLQMPCMNYEPRITIGEYGASEGEWYIAVELFHVEEYEVQEAKHTPEGVVILTTDIAHNIDVEFILSEDKPGIFKMDGVSYADGEYLIYKEAMSNYPTRLCDDVETIMDMVSDSWIPLNEREDGSFFIHEECMYGSGSISFDKDGSAVHFSGGGDQMSYSITDMNMSGGAVNITYFDDMNQEDGTLTIENLMDSKSVIKGTSGWIITEYYVPGHLMEEYEVVEEEPCDDY